MQASKLFLLRACSAAPVFLPVAVKFLHTDFAPHPMVSSKCVPQLLGLRLLGHRSNYLCLKETMKYDLTYVPTCRGSCPAQHAKHKETKQTLTPCLIYEAPSSAGFCGSQISVLWRACTSLWKLKSAAVK